MKKIFKYLIILLSIYCYAVFAQETMPQMGGDFRPSYESYRLDKFIEGGEVSYSGNLLFSIPLLTVPGRHGHNFDIKINYNSDIRQRQSANWVGLGWDLEIGAVERTINGRADEPGHNCSYGSLGLENCTGIGNLGGRFKSDFLNDPLEYRDVLDQYQLLIDGGGMQIVPFSDSLMITLTGNYDSTIVSYDDFLPLQYRPWSIVTSLDYDGAFKGFTVQKEDGTVYTYGNIGTVGNGQVEWIRVGDMDANPPQQYKFPYRWNLNKIEYPDGSATTIEYEFQNSSSNRLYRRHESVMIDRSKVNNVGNYFGQLPSSASLCPGEDVAVDSVYYEYSHPSTLYTDTHYLVFKTSSGGVIINETSKNCRLDTLILYERYTNIELRRIVFHYADNNNHLSECSSLNDNWVEGERLKNNQLTLIGITIQNGAGSPIPPIGVDEGSTETQKYYFTYTTNPNIKIEGISRYVASGYPEWPGHYSYSLGDMSKFGKAWRLETITLPTGGRYTYEYDTLLVNFGPEGETNFTTGWNHSSEPVSRLITKSFEDGFDSQRIWTYSYSPQVVFDPPASVSQSSYVPNIFRTSFYNYPDQYYKWVRSCTVGHRWVKINNPDGSWKKTYFTSSYQGPDTNHLETYPDFFEQTPIPPIGSIINKSFAGCRGLVWKEEVGSGTTIKETIINEYTFIPQAYLKDRYDYYLMLGDLQGRVFSLLTSIWARLDKSTVIKDGITTINQFEYFFSPRWIPYENGLIRNETVENTGGITKTTWYNYAYREQEYEGMKELGMWSQLYKTRIIREYGNFGGWKDESMELTKWRLFSNHWLPDTIYHWNGAPDDIWANDNNCIAVNLYTYDNYGFSNIITQADANGNVTKYYYGNAANPFTNTTEGLRRGYVTGVEQPQASPLLRTSFKYDHFGNVVEKVGENGDTTIAEYDDLGRIISVTDALDKQIQKYSYSMPSDNTVITPSDPNSITAISYFNQNDSTIAKSFFDGGGFERQKMSSFGNLDIVSATTYDPLWHIERTYKPYQINLGVNKHEYDTSYHNNSISYYGFTLPYSANEYYTDGTGRLMKTTPEGEPWQTHTIDYLYTSAQNLFLTSSTDENGIQTRNYFDKFGNNIRTISDYGGLNLTTEFKYDLMNRVIGVKPPSTQPTYYKDSVITTLYPPLETKVISIDVPEDPGTKYFHVVLSTEISPMSFGPGDNPDDLCPYIRFTYQQYNDGDLVHESQNIGLEVACYNDTKTSPTYESPVQNADMVKLNIYEIWYANPPIELEVKFVHESIYEGITTTYVYNKRGLLVEKTTADAGTVKYLYDKAGNLRFTQDANQTPSDKFTYQKYDELNRLIQVGEYTASHNFTQENADDVNFPLNNDPNRMIQKSFSYDIAGLPEQRNLLGNLSRSFVYDQGNIVQISFFSYDENNRVEWLLHQYQTFGDKKISYWYDWQGNVIKKCVSDLEGTSLYTFYEYDEAGRLSKVFTNTIDSEVGQVKEAEYSYRADGNVDTLMLGNAQEMEYLYNERSWLTQINHQNLYGDDKFGEVIGYNNQGHIAAGTGFTWQPQYNGNISWNIMRTKDVGLQGVNAGYPDPIIGYVYNYDNANRLTKADFGYYNSTSGWSNSLPKAAMYDLPLVTYDNDGNILDLQRNGVNATLIDDFDYAYVNNNRLTTITNFGSQVFDYSYDNNGNVISDSMRGINSITYDINNLPKQMTKTGGSTVNYWYDTNGNRFRKQEAAEDLDEYYLLGINGETEAVIDANGTIKFFNINAGNETIGRYISGAEVDLYLTNQTLVGEYQALNTITAETNVVVNGTATLTAGTTIYLKPGFTANNGCNFTVSIGTVTDETARYYHLKDHLGSIRVTVDEAGERVNSDDYDPWGLQLNGRSTNLAYNDEKYKFTGKERDVETGYDYFGARYYDSRIGRWLQVDPLPDRYPGWSTYNYTMNNPTKFVDLDGRAPTEKGGPLEWLLKKIAKKLGEKLGKKFNDDNMKKGFGNKDEDLDEDGTPDNEDEIDDREMSRPWKEESKRRDEEGSERLKKAIEDAKRDRFNPFKPDDKGKNENDSDSSGSENEKDSNKDQKPNGTRDNENNNNSQKNIHNDEKEKK